MGRMYICAAMRTVSSLGWDMRKERKSLIDSYDALIRGENDLHIQPWCLCAERSEVLLQSSEHFLGTFDVEAKVALRSVANFFLQMEAAVLTIRVGEEMKDIDMSDIMKCRE